MGTTVWIEICSLQRIMVDGGDNHESYLKDGVDWILEKFVIAIVDNWTVFQMTVLVAPR